MELKTIDSSIIGLIILIFIYINAYKRSDKILLSYKLFIYLLLTNITMIIVDILGWVFNGRPDSINMVLNKGFNVLLYILAPVAAIIWILYTNYQVFNDVKRVKRAACILLIPFTINALVAVISLITGWFYYIDIKNIYHRGDYFWIHVLYCYVLLIYALIFVIINKKKIEKRYYYTLLLFFLPQSIGTTIQVFHYGVSYNWIGMMISILILYLNIQDRSLNTDYLTGVFNRRQLDSFVRMKIQNCTEKKTFSAILVDLNEFKQINDRFGHDVGDDALQEATKIIKKCIHKDDFVARFGGDEFYIILDICNEHILQQIIEKIKEYVQKFNEDGQKPYKLSFCMGYDVYDYKLKMSSEDFFKHIDILMYKNKAKSIYVKS